jgi:cytidine deaminase
MQASGRKAERKLGRKKSAKSQVQLSPLIRRAWKAAVKARERAYAPYSEFQVGASVLGARGKMYSGCNVENASFGATICAERNAMLHAVAEGLSEWTDVVVVTDMSPPACPCALCLQVLSEFAVPGARVWLADPRGVREVVSLRELLPRHFGPRELSEGTRT